MIIIIFFIFLIIRLLHVEVAYDDMLNYIHKYNCFLIFKKVKNDEEDEKIDYDEMMSVYVYMLMFWQWDKWAIITNPISRIKLKAFIEKMEYEDREH